MKAKFPFEPWRITEQGFVPENLRENESIFALANGYLGLRGNLEENRASGVENIQGTFINGVFDSEPITYGEAAYGYAKNHETICNIMDAKSIRLRAGDEALDMGVSQVRDHIRSLDMQQGLLIRSFTWQTKNGACLKVELKRLVSLVHQHLAALQVEVECLSGTTALAISGGIAPAIITEGDPNDPRNAAGKDRSLHTIRPEAEGKLLAMSQSTKNTHQVISCAVAYNSTLPGENAVTEEAVSRTLTAELSAGAKVQVEVMMAYYDGPADEEGALRQQAKDACTAAPAFEELAKAQRAYLADFWLGAGMSIKGDDALLQGLRFNLFHLLQSAGRDGLRNIAAKGLTGEGYEGHYFWDTEAYVVPVFLHTEPMVARKLLEYRYSILENARQRARIMGHDRGALFAWRTIDGEECSAYFPAGSAQYHINGDIANAIRDYYYTTRDLDFLARCGGEMVAETARLYLDLGFYSEAKGGRFVINGVTGPDEYNVLVNNNTYTNRVAEENFRFAAEVMALLEEKAPADYQRLCDTIGYHPSESREWLQAADAMYYPPKTGEIYPQDDEFLNRKPWPLESIPADKHPLLIHYHGLVIYRHMVCKQADLILAMTVFGDRYSLEEKKANFTFYDSVTTHDSSLSMAVFSMLAAEIGEVGKAYDYFMSSARLDLDDMHHNAKDGLHMANMAGTWNCMVKGFGGMRYVDDTLSFAPVCPPQWEGYAFRVRFRGRTIDVEVDRAGAKYTLVEGESITILSNGETVEL